MDHDDRSAVEIAWLAGLLEGEGSFMPGPPSNPRMPIVCLAMNDADVMARVGRLLGRKVVPLRRRSEHWQQSYQLRVRGRQSGFVDDAPQAADGLKAPGADRSRTCLL
jgi:hypothetical protein